MKREGACPCRAVRYVVDGPVRDVLVCHCDACKEATGGPWAASAVHRGDLVIADDDALIWERAAVSEYDASRGRCGACGTTVFWDAPGRDTISFGVATLADASGLEVVAHIWVPEEESEELRGSGLPVEPAGLPESVSVRWREETPETG